MSKYADPMNLPTDNQLREQAHKTLMGNETTFGLVMSGLKSDRESYLLLKECEDRLYVAGTYAPAGLMSHLTTLRTRLGITE